MDNMEKAKTAIREIDAQTISDTVRELCIRSNRILPPDVKTRLEAAQTSESNPLGREILGDLIENYRLAEQLDIAVCQDTGTAVVFLELGQEVHITGGLLADAVNDGVARGYTEGFLRCSIAADPLRRVNTQNNTPAVLHTRIVPGDRLTITVAPKGAGSENMSSIKMFTPAAKQQDIMDYVVGCVTAAGSNPCPPVIVGVGIGGNFEQCALLAKQALCRSTDIRHPDAFYADMEAELLTMINATDVGPQGFGGVCTALAVNIEFAPVHIASLPVAVNMGCHVTRHQTAVL